MDLCYAMHYYRSIDHPESAPENSFFTTLFGQSNSGLLKTRIETVVLCVVEYFAYCITW